MNKNHNTVLSLTLFTTFTLSCSFNQSAVFIIKTLNQFPTQKENKQLGKDLLSFNYTMLLQEQLPDLTAEELGNIKWSYFIQDDSKDVSFRLTLTNQAIRHQDRIKSIFEKAVNNQVDKQVAHKEIFLRSIDKTLDNLVLLDNHKEDSFWANTSDILKDRSSQSDFFEAIKGREGILKEDDQRILQYKLYYDSIPGVDETGFYVVCFGFKNDMNMYEQITYHYENHTFKITGYDYRVAN